METPEQELARLRAENQALKAGQVEALRFKISEKGGISVYGLGKWPVTLYRSQWAILLANASGIQQFIDAHRSRLDGFEQERMEQRARSTTGSSKPRSTQDMDKALDDF